MPVAFQFSTITYNTLQDEDPSPTRQTLSAVQLHQAKSEDTGESRRHTADEVENGKPFLDVI
jgi:hypothetical protein